jgi:hypothetical protein
MLFKSGTDNVQVGNTTYVPGNDDDAAQKMRLYTAATAMATAKLYVDEIADSMSTITGEIANATTTDEQSTIVAEFGSQVKDKYNKIIAILLDPTTGAITYYNDNGESDYASDTQDYAMSLYKDYQDAISALLVGDPTSTVYTGILYDLNMAYQTQEMYTTDADEIALLQTKVAELFKNAADACMAYTTVDAAGITNHYYDNAAIYYNAAVAKYTANGDTANADASTVLEYQAYAKDGLQDVAVYLYSKTNGVSYSDAAGTVHSITLDQLISDYQAFSTQFSLSADQSMSPNEITLYNDMESLFLNGAMVLSAAASGPTLSTDGDDEDDSSAANSTESDSLDPDVVTFLTANNITLTEGTETIDNPDYVDPDTSDSDAGDDAIASAIDAVASWNSDDSDEDDEDDNPKTIEVAVYSLDENYDVYEQIFEFNSDKITSLAAEAVDQFVANENKSAMSSWLTTLFNAVGYIYIQDYLATSSSSSTDDLSAAAEQQEEFYERLQAQGVANQNPASIYMG